MERQIDMKKNLPKDDKAFLAANLTDCTSHLLRYNSRGTESFACKVKTLLFNGDYFEESNRK